MSQVIQDMPQTPDEITVRELLIVTIKWMNFLKAKWLLIMLLAIVAGIAGFIYARFQKPVYTAELTFALDDDKGAAGGLSGAMGLANSLGIDLGSGAGSAFSGSNLIELMKSRTLVEKAFLNSISVNNKQITLADYYIDINHLNKEWDKKPELVNIRFDTAVRRGYSLQKDSILGVLYSMMVGKSGGLTISEKDKKSSIISVQVRSGDEMFAKAFVESIAREISEFYIETKSKKAKLNVEILQKQTDSVRNELNNAISGVASSSDNTFNLNPALNIKRAPTTRKQVDVQANTAILTQLVANLEMAKVTLLKETPLIQVIDKPILPLKKDIVSGLKTALLWAIIATFVTIVALVIKRYLSGFQDKQMATI